MDAATGKPFVDVVVDQAEQKGTGRWTVQIALDLGVPVSGIAEAVFARSLSGHAALREASRGLAGPKATPAERVGGGGLRRPGRAGAVRVEDRVVHAGLPRDRGGQRGVRLGHRPGRRLRDLAWRLHHPGGVPGPDPRRVRHPGGPAEPAVRRHVRAGDRGRRRTTGARCWSRRPARACPTPGFAAALAYYDALRAERLPAALTQGQRDFFGAHTYRRTDREGSFHTLWGGDRSEVTG